MQQLELNRQALELVGVPKAVRIIDLPVSDDTTYANVSPSEQFKVKIVTYNFGSMVTDNSGSDNPD